MPILESPADGTPLRYDISGDGPPLVLLHGSVLTRAIWRGLGYLGTLSDIRTVIRMDLRGHGSSGTPHDPAAYTQERFLADLFAVLDHLGYEAADLMGYSLGARIALTAAVRQPQRVTRLVSLGGTPAAQAGALDRVFFPGVIDTVREHGMDEFCTRQGLGADVADQRARATRAVFMTADPLAIAAMFTATDCTGAIPDEELAECEVPALWMAGTEDEPRCAQSRAAAAVMPHARFVPLPGRGHGDTLAPSAPILDEVLPFLTGGGTTA